MNYDFFFIKTATRIFQALRSLNPPIAAVQLPIENAQKGMYWFHIKKCKIYLLLYKFREKDVDIYFWVIAVCLLFSGGKQLRMVIRETNNLLQHLYSEFLEEPVHTQWW